MQEEIVVHWLKKRSYDRVGKFGHCHGERERS